MSILDFYSAFVSQKLFWLFFVWIDLSLLKCILHHVGTVLVSDKKLDFTNLTKTNHTNFLSIVAIQNVCNSLRLSKLELHETLY